MDGILQLAVLLAALNGPAHSAVAPADALMPDRVPAFGAGDRMINPPHAGDMVPTDQPTSAAAFVTRPLRVEMQAPSDPWTSEDKFRHVAASWAAMVFTFAAVRSVHDEPDTALAIAVPVTAAFGIAKEIVDHRHGGPFSFRDLAADALGAGAAWLFLREVH
ncbi:MAG TPA: hypothetical protein VK912_11575 [Longimicrobiales bacterium]|nr:hypothetical protein [Longimicrobiales bacterium]